MPRNLSFTKLTERPWRGLLEQATIVGHTTSSSSKIWVRMVDNKEYILLISEFKLKDYFDFPMKIDDKYYLDNQSKLFYSAKFFSSTGDHDFTSIINVDELNEDTTYYYAVVDMKNKKWMMGNRYNHQFKTLPKNYTSDDFLKSWDITFGLYSCHMPFHDGKDDVSMWNLFKRELDFSNVKFVIGGGDQVYVDGTDKINIWKWLKKVKDEDPTIKDMVSWYRDIYRGYWSFPELQNVHKSYPNYMIWDDHEIMDGWGSFFDDELSSELDTWFEWEDKEKNLKLANNMFEAAKQVYEEYQHSHNPDTGRELITNEKIYDYSFSPCGTDFFVLDMRGKRNFENETNAILGSAQQTRFDDWTQNLQRNKNTPIFIVSTVPIVHLKDFVSDMLDWLSVFGARDDVRDHWAHDKHQDEVTWLLDSLFRCSHETGRPLVVLSGDVHIGGVFSLTSNFNNYPNAKVFQVTSSAITYAALGPAKMNLLSKAVAQHGKIGVRKDETDTGFSFKNHFIFPQHNFSLIRYCSDTEKTTNIFVELIGKSDDMKRKESRRIDLLNLSD